MSESYPRCPNLIPDAQILADDDDDDDDDDDYDDYDDDNDDDDDDDWACVENYDSDPLLLTRVRCGKGQLDFQSGDKSWYIGNPQDLIADMNSRRTGGLIVDPWQHCPWDPATALRIVRRRIYNE